MSPRRPWAGGDSIWDMQPRFVSLSESVRTQETLVIIANLEQENGKVNRSIRSEMVHEVFDTSCFKDIKINIFVDVEYFI